MAEAVIVPENELLDRTGLALRPLPGGFGVELAGLNLRQRQEPGIGALLPHLWRQYGLLLIRRQDLGPAEVAAFGAAFGEPRHTTRPDRVASPQVGGWWTIRRGRHVLRLDARRRLDVQM